MGRSTKSGGTPRQTPSSWKGKSHLRCKEGKCRKRAKDVVDGVPLCRIHSPMRMGFKRIYDEINRKDKKKR